MKWPDDFNWKHKVIVNSPKIASIFAATLCAAAAIAMITKGLNVVTVSFSLLVLFMAAALLIVGHELTYQWKKNLRQDLGSDAV